MVSLLWISVFFFQHIFFFFTLNERQRLRRLYFYDIKIESFGRTEALKYAYIMQSKKLPKRLQDNKKKKKVMGDFVFNYQIASAIHHRHFYTANYCRGSSIVDKF